MATSMRHPHEIIPFLSSLAANTPEGSLVVLDTADGTVKLPGGSAPTTPLLGLLFQAQPGTANMPAQVVTSGVFPGIAGAGITRGAELTSNGTDGTLVTAAPGGGTNCAIVGVALESASTGERVAVLITKYIKQG